MDIICKKCGANEWKVRSWNVRGIVSLTCGKCIGSMITISADTDIQIKGSTSLTGQGNIFHYTIK
jgi:Zn finger protein HypA/HybF involved in hydrogenase expression